MLVALPLTILFLGALLAKLPVRRQLAGLPPRDGLPPFLYALAIAGIGLLVAAMTPRRGLGVAAVISVLLILSGIQLAVMSIATEFDSTPLAAYSGLLSPFSLVDGVATKLFGAESSLRGGSARHAGHGCLHCCLCDSGRRLLRMPAHLDTSRVAGA